MSDPASTVVRLTAAMNAGDADAVAACFHDDYRSEQPVHPDRAFTGSAQVRKNWAALLGSIEGLRAEVTRSAVDGETIWFEFHWTGTKADGAPFEEWGTAIMGVRDGRSAWARLYAEEVDEAGRGIDEAVSRMAGRG